MHGKTAYGFDVLRHPGNSPVEARNTVVTADRDPTALRTPVAREEREQGRLSSTIGAKKKGSFPDRDSPTASRIDGSTT
jgi:hypothetical protein